MGICFNEECLNEATFKCSGCKTTWYCGETCQKKMRSSHKKECTMQRLLYDMEQQREEEERTKPVKKPRTTHCTGCNVRFEEDEYECDQECPDCGYLTCESCSCDTSRGSCYCENSNFGNPYCNLDPQYYHCSSRTGRMYKGDRHPTDGYSWNIQEHPEAYEEKARACNNCGEITRCLLKKFC